MFILQVLQFCFFIFVSLICLEFLWGKVWRSNLILFFSSFLQEFILSLYNVTCVICLACVYVDPFYALYSVLLVKMSTSMLKPHCFNCYNPISYYIYWDICTVKFALFNIKFGIFTKLCNYYHCLIPEQFITPKRNCIRISSLFPLNPSSWQPLIYFHSL